MNARQANFAEVAKQFTAGNPAPYDLDTIKRQTAQLQNFHRDIAALPPVEIRCTPKELKHAIIDCDPLSHEDLVDVLMNLAAKVKKGKGSALGEKCAAIVSDALTNLADEIDQDKTNQDAERAYQLATRS